MAHQALLPFLLNTPLLYQQEENDGNEIKIFNKCVKRRLRKGQQCFLKSLRFLFVSRLYVDHFSQDGQTAAYKTSRRARCPRAASRGSIIRLCFFWSLRCGLAGMLSQTKARAQEVRPGRDTWKQAPVLLNGPIMAWIRRNVFLEPRD